MEFTLEHCIKVYGPIYGARKIESDISVNFDYALIDNTITIYESNKTWGEIRGNTLVKNDIPVGAFEECFQMPYIRFFPDIKNRSRSGEYKIANSDKSIAGPWGKHFDLAHNHRIISTLILHPMHIEASFEGKNHFEHIMVTTIYLSVLRYLQDQSG